MITNAKPQTRIAKQKSALNIYFYYHLQCRLILSFHQTKVYYRRLKFTVPDSLDHPGSARHLFLEKLTCVHYTYSTYFSLLSLGLTAMFHGRSLLCLFLTTQLNQEKKLILYLSNLKIDYFNINSFQTCLEILSFTVVNLFSFFCRVDSITENMVEDKHHGLTQTVTFSLRHATSLIYCFRLLRVA